MNLSEEDLLETARRRTGLSDWGGDSFRAGLRVLLESDNTEAHLSLLGKLAVRFEYLRSLCNRLRIQDTFNRHPEILDCPIRRPLFIVGFPRTGTTLLHNLLALDPQARAPLMWELLWPAPPEGDGPDPRIKWAKRGMGVTYALMPGLRVAHPVSATAPEECFFLLENEFLCLGFEMVRYVPRYAAWLFKQDFIPAYASYRRQLQLLQWRRPPHRWVLKSPFHLPSLDALLCAFPDASIIQTHRDLAEVAPSMCSLMHVVRRGFSRHVDPLRLGKDWLDTWSEAISRAMRVRANSDPGLFIDVDYRELIADPIGVVRRLYAQLGLTFTTELGERMKSWLNDERRQERRAHRYALADFGLSRAMIEERFATYAQSFLD